MTSRDSASPREGGSANALAQFVLVKVTVLYPSTRADSVITHSRPRLFPIFPGKKPTPLQALVKIPLHRRAQYTSRRKSGNRRQQKPFSRPYFPREETSSQFNCTPPRLPAIPVREEEEGGENTKSFFSQLIICLQKAC